MRSTTQFLFLHCTAVVLHAFCAVYAYTNPLMQNTRIPTQVHRVSYASPNGTYFDVIETSTVFLPSVIEFHAIVAVLTVAFHLCVYVPVHLSLAHVVWTQGYFAPRWIEYSASCTLMSISSYASAGNLYFNSVVTNIIHGIALQMVGALIEQTKSHYKALVALGVLINFGSAYGTLYLILSATGSDAYQWIEFAAYTFFYSLFPFNSVWDAARRPRGGFVQTDWIYNVLSLSSKLALFWIQVGSVEKEANGGLWPLVQIYFLGIVLPMAILLLGLHMAPSASRPGSVNLRQDSSLRLLAAVYRPLARLRFVPLLELVDGGIIRD